ncbi:MAG: ABC transporter substrate-binding protein [Anaerolineae bacterium]
MRAINRRTFLVIAGMSATAAAAAACGGTPVPATAPAATATTAAQATAAPTSAPTTAAAATTAPTVAATTAPTTAPTQAAQATTAAPGRYSEAPMLAEMVAAGDLPPVEERLPREPLIQPVVDEIGQYGGVWHRGAVSASDTALFFRLYSDGLLNFDIVGNLVPAVASSWDVSDDGTEFTLHLREGMRWSDGEPYTADAVMWWHDHVYSNAEITPTKPSWMRTGVGGEYGTIEKVDDYTLRFTFSEPYGTFPDWLGTGQFYGVPGHYLEQFHVDFTDKAEIEAAAKEKNFEQWFQLFNDRNNPYNNPDRPTVGPWKFNTPPDANPMVAMRNPYYYRVDEQGQQLPYIDEIDFEIVTNVEVLNFNAVAGAYDCQERQINLVNYPLFVDGAEAGDYRILTWPGDGGTDAGLMFNMNAGQQENANEHQVVIGDILRTLEFRQALSIGLNRDEIWNTAFLGFGEPRQMAPMPWNKYYEEGMETPYTEYDAEQANSMLDALGLDQRDADGFRLGSDGQPLDIIISAVQLFGPWVDTAQLANNHWNEVGIKTAVNIEERTLYYTRLAAGEHQIAVWNTGGNGKVLIYPYWTMPFSNGSRIGPLSGNWYQSGGSQGVEPTGDLRKVLDLFDEATVTIDMAAQDELAKEIFRTNSANLWTIGTVGGTPLEQGVVIAKNNFLNVPESTPERHVWSEDSVHTPSNCVPAQYFMKQA